MNNKDFYIGWDKRIPSGHGRMVWQIILMLAGIGLIVPLLFVLSQDDFSNATFDFSNEVEIRGTLLKDPVPMLRVIEGDQVEHLLLVSFGKFGAERDILTVENQMDIDLDGRTLTVRGHIFRRDGRRGFQLTDRERSFSDISNEALPWNGEDVNKAGIGSLQGEIVDSKCFLGVMKPGEGIVHRSCAGRCIAGGIMPIFTVINSQDQPQHYILLDENGEKPGDEIKRFIGNPVQLCGEIVSFHDWKLLYVDTRKHIVRLNGPFISIPPELCAKQ